MSFDEDLGHCVGTVFDAARAFFSSGLNEKLSDRLALDAGFRPYGVEYSDLHELPDDVESFTFNPKSDPGALRLLTPRALALHAAMSRLYETLMPPLAAATVAVAKIFGVSDLDAEIASSLREWSLLQLNSARRPTDERDFINVEHEDGCLLTAMIGTAPGLEVRLADGTYETVSPAADRMLLAAGEILWLLTGGAIPAIFHRVRRIETTQPRMSLLLFADLGPALCGPWVVGNANQGVNIAEKVLENSRRYGLQAWSPPLAQARSRT